MVIKENSVFLERAGDDYVRDRDGSGRPIPSVSRNKLDMISRAALKLLRHMGIRRLADAPDGPPDADLVDLLIGPTHRTEDAIAQGTSRIAKFVEIVEAAKAARAFQQQATRRAKEVMREGTITGVKRGRRGLAEKNWIADVLVIYRHITGEEPRVGGGELWVLSSDFSPLPVSR